MRKIPLETEPIANAVLMFRDIANPENVREYPQGPSSESKSQAATLNPPSSPPASHLLFAPPYFPAKQPDRKDKGKKYLRINRTGGIVIMLLQELLRTLLVHLGDLHKVGDRLRLRRVWHGEG